MPPPDAQVWNYPVLAFRSTQVFPAGLSAAEQVALRSLDNGSLAKNAGCRAREKLDAASGLAGFRGRAGKGVACVVDLVTEVWHLDLTTPTDAPDGALRATRMELKYSVELDADGYVTGGEWDLASPTLARPDVLWIPKVDVATIGVESKGSLFDYELLQKLGAP